MHVNFHDKNSWLLHFLWLATAVLWRQFMLSFRPQFLHMACMRWARVCKYEEKYIKQTRKDDPFRIPVLRQRLSIRLDALHRRDTFIFLGDFYPSWSVCCESTCMYVHACACYPHTKFREENFHDQKSNHKIHKMLYHENLELYGYWSHVANTLKQPFQ